LVREPLQQHLYKVKALHERDLATGTGGVALPHAIERAYPNANREWGWQWVFLQAVTTSTARPASGVGITSTNR
jgi:hypothetical protein